MSLKMGAYLRDRFNWFYNGLQRIGSLIAHFLYAKLIEPISSDEDTRRHEFILNSILSGSIAMLVLLDAFTLFNSIKEGASYRNISFLAFSGIVLFFVFLHYLSRRGYFRGVAYVLVSFYYLIITYSVLRWGVSLPANLLGYGLVIIMSSILIDSRFGLFSASVVAGTLIFLGYFESTDNMIPAWKQRPVRIVDVVQYSIILFLITMLSWLSNREIEKSLFRARRSEDELRKERDSLEEKVKERTEELMKEKIERLSELYRFAEFGKLSSGIFHDLMSPLTSLVLSVGKMKLDSEARGEIDQMVESAKRASNKVENLISTVRKQIQNQEVFEEFCLNDEIAQIAELLRYKTNKEGVVAVIDFSEKIVMRGNPFKFNQIILNLISNAIDAYDGVNAVDKYVWIKLYRNGNVVYLWVRDKGKGIAPEIADRIFDPLFTTKSPDKGMGLGLSTTKSIVENDFKGIISVESIPGNGSIFKVSFPMNG